MSDARPFKLVSRRRVLIGAGLGAAALAAGSALLYRPTLALRPGRSRAEPVPSDPDISAEADAVVIGGGDTGVMTALCLAERGLKVALCEKGVIAGESSCRSTGFVDSMFVGPLKTELTLRAKMLWPGLSARIDADSSYQRTGVAIVMRDESEEAAARAWIESVGRQPLLDPKLLPCQGLVNLGSGAKCRSVLFQPSDGQAEPRTLAPAIARAGRAKGVSIHQNCAVRGIERAGGAVTAVVTEHGPIKTRIVVLAGGVWAPLFLDNLGLSLPQVYAFASNQRVSGASAPPAIPGVCGTALWRPESGGACTIGHVNGQAPITRESARYAFKLLPAIRHLQEVYVGIGQETWRSFTVKHRWRLDERSPFEDIRIYEPVPDTKGLDQVWRDCREFLPGLAQAQVMERYAGALTTAPDNLPVISTVQSVPGLLIGAGLYYGLTLCPSVGELLADLATGTKPQVDPRPFRYERLVDGSNLTFDE